MSPDIMDPKAIAERWGVHEQSVRRLIRKGELPFFRAGGTLIRVRVKDVEDYECGKLQGSAPNGDMPSPGETDTEGGTVTRLEPMTRARLSRLRQPSIQN